MSEIIDASSVRICFCDLNGRPIGDRGAHDTTCLMLDFLAAWGQWEKAPPWTPFRNRIPRASKCYRLTSGNPVHVKPWCRCPR